MKPEEKLSPDIRAKADISSEYSWKQEDILDAVQDAEKNNLANLGGQMQYLFPGGGVCDFYWIDYHSLPRNTEEPWGDYVARTAKEISAQIKNIIENKDLIQEGINGFEIIKEKAKDPNINLREYIYFVLYLESEESGSN